MKYKYFLFDVDNTILDFSHAEKQALFNTSNIHNINCSEEDYKRYSEINDSCWKKLEKGLFTREELVINRFKEYLPTVNSSIDPAVFNKTFLNQLALGNKPLDGAIEVIKKIWELKGKIYIVTNGFYKVQKKRLAPLNIDSFIEDYFVSEDIGYSKPDVKFFEEVEKRIGNSIKNSSIIIGDSLTSDIKGGINFGIDTCWFNPKNLPLKDDLKPTYIVDKLEDIIDKVR